MRLALVPAAILELLGSAWADVNGPNYDWWTWSLRAAAVLTLVLAIAPPPRVAGWCAAAAAPVAIAAVAVQTQHFNDSYDGSRIWPGALAVVFAAACVAAAGYLRRESDSLRRSGGRTTAR